MNFKAISAILLIISLDLLALSSPIDNNKNSMEVVDLFIGVNNAEMNTNNNYLMDEVNNVNSQYIGDYITSDVEDYESDVEDITIDNEEVFIASDVEDSESEETNSVESEADPNVFDSITIDSDPNHVDHDENVPYSRVIYILFIIVIYI